MKAVLISIQPKWCELIASGKKTVEVRKTKPKLETPFKCYIYCTKGEPLMKTKGNDCFIDKEHRQGENLYGLYEFLNGKVIGEFVCDKVTEIKSDAVYSKVFGGFDVRFNFDKYASCLTEEQIFDYLGEGKGYAWHITDLVIYDKPKELSEFHIVGCKGCRDKDTYHCKFHCIGERRLKRPPQSWCYVEELKGESE